MRVETRSDGVTWAVHGAIDAWIEDLPLVAASAILSAIEEMGTASAQGPVSLPANIVARMSEPAAIALGLPPNAPLGFDVRLSGSMGKPGAALAVRWLQPGKVVPARDAEQRGLWLDWNGKTYRIASPMFDALRLVDHFNRIQEGAVEEQFRAWARIRETLGEQQSEHLTDGFLRSFRVVSASALTFSISTDQHGAIQIDPVLLVDRQADEGERIERVRALTEADEALFPRRLDQLHEGVPAFPLNQGTYVVVDEPLQRALMAVRRLRSAPADQRKRAAMYPEAVIRELLDLDESAQTVFVETERFAERVRDVGDWSAPVLPWIKIASQEWGAPVSGGVRLNGVEVPLKPEEIQSAVVAMQKALEQGVASISLSGKDLPATTGNLHALQKLQAAIETREGRAPNGDEDGAGGSTQVLIIETNFNEASFNRVTVGKRPGTIKLPSGIRSSPKPHQEAGIQWLQNHWIAGSRGAMLCDDMGLGKTFQALAFCQWLRDLMEQGSIERKPLLIVAPVGLLKNWEREIDDHLLSPGLGDIVRAYGDHIKSLRRGKHLDGTAGLDTARLRGGDVVLANYEAVSDYQLSFGAVPFAVVVLDEAQKIKSPKARMTHAVKGLNSDFVLAMTGTPVENRLADLWCIADAVQPGALADLKDFSSRYETDDADVQELRARVWQEENREDDQPPRMLLRRLKTDKLEGLPRKHEHVIRVPMPTRQAEAYSRALAMRKLSGPEGTLGMIHALRRISLHPILFEGDVGSDDELNIEESARMVAMMGILDQIAASQEKVLVFLESLDLQDAEQLPTVLMRRYKLQKLPMVINGQVNTEARQARVDAFQQEKGFDIMLLSPKAGGVGLTLTAANHVVHLSRWWNPAVEDQCSDRVYRIGQTKPVHIYYPLAVLPGHESSSFDVQLQGLMDRKRSLAKNLLVAPAFTHADYEELLAGTQGN